MLDNQESNAIVAGLDGTRLLDRGKCSLTNWVRWDVPEPVRLTSAR